MKINPLTSAEENIMNVMWKLENAYLKDVLEHHADPKPHQNTVSTFMKILVEKDFLKTQKEGRVFKYSVAIPYNDYRIFQVKSLLENYFLNSATELIKVLHDEKLANSAEIEKSLNIKVTAEKESSKENEIIDFIEEITSEKKKKKKKKDKKEKKKKK